jgi:hypothetical protein
MKQTNLHLYCLVALCVGLFVVESTGKPIDFSELDRVVPEELKAKNTPGVAREQVGATGEPITAGGG